MAYHPKFDKYVYLKAKMTRGVLKKFLKANNLDSKSLPMKEFASKEVRLNKCSNGDSKPT